MHSVMMHHDDVKLRVAEHLDMGCRAPSVVCKASHPGCCELDREWRSHSPRLTEWHGDSTMLGMWLCETAQSLTSQTELHVGQMSLDHRQ